MILKVTDPGEVPVLVPGAFLFLGNHPALDFLNTAPIVEGTLVDRIVDYDTLVRWLEQAELIVPEDASRARARFGKSARGAEAVARAREVRDLFRSFVKTTVEDGARAPALLEQLNEALREETGAFTEIVQTKAAFARRTRLLLEAPVEVLTPLLRSLAALLSDVDLSLVRKCESSTCVLYFHDISKNHGRRWCSMEACGNRHKVDAYRTRGRRKA